MNQTELIELIDTYKNKKNIEKKSSTIYVNSFEELKNVFKLKVTFDSLFDYKEAIDYIIANEIYRDTMDKELIQKHLLDLFEHMCDVYDEKISEAYWYDEHNLAKSGLNSLSRRIKDITDESNYFLVHLPHYGTSIPEKYEADYYLDKEELYKNVFEYADYGTYNLYGSLYREFDGVANPNSRLFFDPERFFDDEQESMQTKHGLGWFYENAILDKKPLRSTIHKDEIAQYYHKHHAELNAKTAQKLRLYGRCTIIDCHSFSNTRYWFHDKSLALPDICIGYDDFHKDEFLVNTILEEFEAYDVGVNTPYVGSLVPTDYYNKNENVKSVMIEINKKLYLEPNTQEMSKGSDLIKEKIENIKNKLLLLS